MAGQRALLRNRCGRDTMSVSWRPNAMVRFIRCRIRPRVFGGRESDGDGKPGGYRRSRNSGIILPKFYRDTVTNLHRCTILFIKK